MGIHEFFPQCGSHIVPSQVDTRVREYDMCYFDVFPMHMGIHPEYLGCLLRVGEISQIDAHVREYDTTCSDVIPVKTGSSPE
jgi:hypothetical protein